MDLFLINKILLILVTATGAWLGLLVYLNNRKNGSEKWGQLCFSWKKDKKIWTVDVQIFCYFYLLAWPRGFCIEAEIVVK